MTLKYYTKEELLPYVNKEVEFLTWDSDTRVGVLEAEYDSKPPYGLKNLWLPFCGGVRATTVKINLEVSK